MLFRELVQFLNGVALPEIERPAREAVAADAPLVVDAYEFDVDALEARRPVLAQDVERVPEAVLDQSVDGESHVVLDGLGDTPRPKPCGRGAPPLNGLVVGTAQGARDEL